MILRYLYLLTIDASRACIGLLQYANFLVFIFANKSSAKIASIMN